MPRPLIFLAKTDTKKLDSPLSQAKMTAREPHWYSTPQRGALMGIKKDGTETQNDK